MAEQFGHGHEVNVTGALPADEERIGETEMVGNDEQRPRARNPVTTADDRAEGHAKHQRRE